MQAFVYKLELKIITKNKTNNTIGENDLVIL